MLRILRGMAISLVFFPSFLLAQEVDSVTLEVRVEGIKNNKGEVGVALFNSPTGYPTQLQYANNIKWMNVEAGPEFVEAIFEGVPLGEYAIAVLHDENVNGVIETNPSGFPMEGVGFSNNQKIITSAPSFSASKFTLSKAEPMKMTIQLDYKQ